MSSKKEIEEFKEDTIEELIDFYIFLGGVLFPVLSRVLIRGFIKSLEKIDFKEQDNKMKGID